MILHQIQTIRGIHPGFMLDRELKKRHLGKSKFALAVNEYPQTISAITKGKRDMNVPLALKIEKALDLEEGYLMILQTYFDIEKVKRKEQTAHPDYKKLRPALFWDTNMQRINWQKQKRAVIERVFDRGNETEKKEITRFYGKDVITEMLNGGK